MRTILAALCLLSAVGLPRLGVSQGLVAIQNQSGDFHEDSPLTWSLSARGGYDYLRYENATPGFDSFESYYAQGGISATITEVDPTTSWSLALDLGAIQYFDDIPRYDDTYYNARLAFNIVHQATERLKFSNNTYVTYEAQPNVALGGTTNLFNGQYFYGYSNFNVSYAWSQRFSTTTSYTVDGIVYEDSIVSDSEDRLSQLIAQQFAYSISRQTSLTAEYRFRDVAFAKSNGRDYQSHFALAGVDHAWSQRFTGSFRAGAEFYKSERVSDSAPYAEVALNYNLDRKTQFRWFGSVGFDAAELATYDSRYSLRTGVQLNHRINSKVGVNAGVQYAYSDFDGGSRIPSIKEHSLLLSAGINYQLTENLVLDANYNYTVLNSDEATREFDRNNLSLGVTASF